MDVTNPRTGKTITLRVGIKESEIDVRCQALDLTNSDFMECYVLSTDMVQTVVNVAAFYEGLGITVIYEKYFSTDGQEQGFTLGCPALSTILHGYDLWHRIDEVLQIVISDGALRIAINDMIQSLYLPDNIPINCYRAVETVRHSLSDCKEASETWKRMRDTLNLDRSYIDPITNASTNPRHGKYRFVNSEKSLELIRSSWNIMARYLAYRLGGNTPLQTDRFPILYGSM